jgi:hypothetical protein
MALSGAASVLAVVIALVLLVAYFEKKQRERGQDPLYAEEVYYYRGGSWRAAAARFRATLASPAQVKIYRASGGASPGKDARCGVWLYGPKPARETPGVTSFARGVWFQQE